MYLNLGLSIVPKDFTLFRIEDVDFESTVDNFKSRVAEKVNFLKENIELCYCGCILSGPTTLSSNGLKEGFVLNVLQKKEKEASLVILPALESEVPDLVRVFQILATRNAHRRILQKLNKPEVLENIISTTPGLSNDATAIIILQHPELLAKLGDSAAVQRVVQAHPTLANAARNLVAAVQNDTLMSPSTSVSSQNLNNGVAAFVVGSDDEEMEFMGNGDSESRTSDNSNEGEHSVNLITPSQVAAALANTAASTTTRSSTDSSAAAVDSSNMLGITPEMMSAALQRVIASTSSANSLPSSSGSQEVPRQQQDSVLTVTKLEELRKLGFTNDAINIQALQLSNGDLEMAVNLILSGLSDDN